MPITITPLFVSESTDEVELLCTLKFTGAYPVGGDTLDFTSVIGYQSPNGRIFTPSSPVICGSINGTGGDSFGLVPGTTLANNKVIVNTASATVQVGAYGAEITGDNNIEAAFQFPRLV